MLKRSSASGRVRRAAVETLEGRAYFAGVGQGLVGEYFSDQALSNLALARTDSTVNFNWAASPGAEPTAVTSALRASTGRGCSATGPARGSFCNIL